MNNISSLPCYSLRSIRFHTQPVDSFLSTFESLLVLKQKTTQRLTAINDTADTFFTQDIFLQQLLTALNQNFAQANFTVEKLAAIMAVCPRTLHRKIIAATTLSPTKLIRLYRLIRAVDLLKQGYLVSDAASAVGIDNLSYFTKCFSKEFKVSPSRYLETINKV